MHWEKDKNIKNKALLSQPRYRKMILLFKTKTFQNNLKLGSHRFSAKTFQNNLTLGLHQFKGILCQNLIVLKTICINRKSNKYP